ncbi:restriction endonuclease subunit S [Leptospira sp. WS60.C2]
MSNWNSTALKNCISYVIDNRGKNPKKYYRKNEFPVIDNYLIKNCIYPNLSNVNRYIDIETFNNFIRNYLQKDDVLMTLVGNGIGNVSLAPSPKVAIIQNTIGLRTNETLLNKFLYYYFISIQSNLLNLDRGSSQPSIKKTDLLEIGITLPPLPTQKTIAHILGTLDDKIELLRQMNETLEAKAKALFKSWFIDFDPVHKKEEGIPTGLPKEIEDLFPSEFEESELGEIPKGWKVGNLGEISVLNPESWNEKNHPERILYLDLSNVKNNQIQNLEEFNYTTAPSRARRVLKNNDTIIGTVRPGNRSYAFIKQNGLTGSTGFAVLRPNSKTHAEFLYLATTSNEMIDYYAHHADGGAYPAISPNFIFNQRYIICPDSAMLVFHQYTNNLLSLVEINNTEIYSLSSLRDSLLPKLISGELEITDKMVTQILETAK